MLFSYITLFKYSLFYFILRYNFNNIPYIDSILYSFCEIKIIEGVIR